MPHRIVLLAFLAVLVLPSALRGQAGEPRLEHFGRNVNSTASELLPVISPDGRTLYFVREGHPDNVGFTGREHDQDIWYSTLDSSGQWSAAANIGAPLNDEWSNAICGISADGNTALVLGYYKNGKHADRGFSLASRTKDGWSAPVGMVIADYDAVARSRTVTASMSADARILLLGFSETEGDGKADLYISERVSDRDWTRPRPLNVNTADDEICPFLAPDNETLYFSSDRIGGYGGYDVYVARRSDTSWYRWSAPVNCGPLINTPFTDMYYTIPASGKYAYFSSGYESYGQMDLSRVMLPDSIRPRPVVLVRGKILDAKTLLPLETDVVYELLPGGGNAGSAHSNPATGDYEIILPYGKNYGYFARKDGYYPVSENLDLTNLTEYQEIERDLYLAPIETGAVVRLNNIFFAFDRHELRPESFPELDRLAALMRGQPAMVIRINGHTDNVGSMQYNIDLSGRRATAVLNYLVGKGIEASRMTIKAFGPTEPVATNETDEGRQRNRRVEFLVVSR